MAITDSFSPDNPASRGKSAPPRTLELTDDGAITIAHGMVNLNKGGVIAATIDAPPASMNGARLVIKSETAQAHTVDFTPGFNGGGTASDRATFGGAIGDAFEIAAWDGVWWVLWLQDVTLG